MMPPTLIEVSLTSCLVIGPNAVGFVSEARMSLSWCHHHGWTSFTGIGANDPMGEVLTPLKRDGIAGRKSPCDNRVLDALGRPRVRATANAFFNADCRCLSKR